MIIIVAFTIRVGASADAVFLCLSPAVSLELARRYFSRML
jgi:hypothetical protein